MPDQEQEPEVIEITDEEATGDRKGGCGDDEHFARTRARFNEAFEEAEGELKSFVEEAREELGDLGQKAWDGLETLRKRVAEFLDEAPWERPRPAADPAPESPPASESPTGE